MLPFTGESAMPCGAIVAQLTHAKAEHNLEGITLPGGEPFAHAVGAVALADAAHALDLSVMIFTGFPLEDLRSSSDMNIHRLLDVTDILVDGPYVREQPETRRRWIGSSNQRVHFLSARCD